VLEGIGVMFRTVGDGPALRESLLPEEVLRLPQELAQVREAYTELERRHTRDKIVLRP